MSSVALAVSLASSLTSLATTAKPLPASPARAASMVALRASRLVCWAIEVMTLMTLPISALLTPSLEMVALVVSAARTPVAATRAASCALFAISRMLALISSVPVATVWTFLLTCSAAAETTPAWADVSSALFTICWLFASSSSEAALSELAFWFTPAMVACSFTSATLRAVTSVAILTTLKTRPISSFTGA